MIFTNHFRLREMIEKILYEIQRLIDYTEVSKLVYIAIDGIAPKGKMKQSSCALVVPRDLSPDNSILKPSTWSADVDRLKPRLKQIHLLRLDRRCAGPHHCSLSREQPRYLRCDPRVALAKAEDTIKTRSARHEKTEKPGRLANGRPSGSQRRQNKDCRKEQRTS